MPNRCHIVPAMAAITAFLVIPAPGSSGQATAQLNVPGVDRALQSPLRRLEPRLPERLERPEPDVVPPEPEKLIESSSPTSVIDAADELLDGTLPQLNLPLRPFRLGETEQGDLIEADRLLVLLPAGQLQQLKSAGLVITAVRELAGLELVLVTAQPPQDTELAAAVAKLRATTTASSVDFNHLYKPAVLPAAARAQSATAEPTAEPLTAERTDSQRIGMIDSSVLTTHPAFHDVYIEAADFSPHEGSRDITHGTAVASLLTAQPGTHGVALYAAGVFFDVPDSGSATTAEAIVTALDWLVREGVTVINVSITGPHNILLERAVAAAVARDVAVVAAVGNNGPHGEPLYPAAYASVIGVTAVRPDHKPFLYANRGPQVEFAAIGVDVQVANSTGGWHLLSGTSMATPVVTRAIAELRTLRALSVPQLRSQLRAAATDLGAAGPDPIYGNGLITNPPPTSAAASIKNANPH